MDCNSCTPACFKQRVLDEKPASKEPSQPKPRRRSFLRYLGVCVDYGLMAFFGCIARFVAKRPIQVLVVTVLIGLLLGVGMLKMDVVTNVEDLYTPQGNIAFVHRDYVESVYGFEPLDVKLFVTAKGGGNGTVLTKPAVLALLDLYDLVTSVNASFNGSTFNYLDDRICYRPGGPGTFCQAVSVLDYWNYSREAISSDTDILRTLNRPFVLTRFGQPVPQDWVIGEMNRTASGDVSAGNALLLTMYIQNNKPGRGSRNVDRYTQVWQEAITPVVKAFSARSADVDVYILSPWEQQEAADSALTSDIYLQAVSAVLLVGYSCLILHKPHPVASQSYLAFANFASVGLAVLGSYGLCSLLGLGFSLVTQSLALLLLGLGTDDMLVTLAAHEETRREMDPATTSIVDRIVATASRARRGVVVASATNFVAFCTGISSELPALRDFMVYAAVGVVLVFIYQSTFFVACLTLDMWRQRANRVDTLCCIVSTAGPRDGCCGREFDPDRPDLAHSLIGRFLPKIILHPVGKAAVLIATAGLLAWGVYGAVHVRQDFNMEWLVPNKAYVHKVFGVRRETFPRASGKGALNVYAYTTNPTTPPLDYFDFQDELAALGSQLQANPFAGTSPPVQSWYASYIKYIGAVHAGELTADGRPPSSPLFYRWLHEFLDSPLGKRFRTDIVFAPGRNDSILSSRMFVLTDALKYSYVQVQCMQSLRETAAAAAPSLDAFAYSYFFIFFEGYAVIQSDTVLAVGIAGAVVFVIMLLVLADLMASVLVAAMVAFIGVELVGFLYWSGLGFNSVTSITVLLAIGIVVDYSAFTAFSFLSQIGTRHERAHKALAHLGVAVFNGGFFMFLAVLPLAISQSFVFQSFFKMFAMIVALGLWHGLLALPVILSLIGPPPFDTALDKFMQKELEAEGGAAGGVLAAGAAAAGAGAAGGAAVAGLIGASAGDCSERSHTEVVVITTAEGGGVTGVSDAAVCINCMSSGRFDCCACSRGGGKVEPLMQAPQTQEIQQ